jgi:hypothetical protein
LGKKEREKSRRRNLNTLRNEGGGGEGGVGLVRSVMLADWTDQRRVLRMFAVVTRQTCADIIRSAS